MQWDMYDECTPLDKIEVYIKYDGSDYIQIPDGSTSYQIDGITCGQHFFEVMIYDSSGLVMTDVCIFIGPGEDDLPVVSFTNCLPLISGHDYNFEWSIADDCMYELVMDVQYKTDQMVDWVDLDSGTTSFYWEEIICGSRWLKVRVWDLNPGNDWVEDTCNFDLIGNDPELWWVPSCPDYVYLSDYTIYWDFDVDCTDVGWTQVEYKKDGGDWEFLDPDAKEYTWEELELGEHTFSVRITDEHSRTVEISCDFERT